MRQAQLSTSNTHICASGLEQSFRYKYLCVRPGIELHAHVSARQALNNTSGTHICASGPSLERPFQAHLHGTVDEAVVLPRCISQPLGGGEGDAVVSVPGVQVGAGAVGRQHALQLVRRIAHSVHSSISVTKV